MPADFQYHNQFFGCFKSKGISASIWTGSQFAYDQIIKLFLSVQWWLYSGILFWNDACRVFPIMLWWIMWSKNVSVNSMDVPFISESMQRCVWALPETLTDSCDYLTSWLTTQMPDTCSIQLQAGRRLSLRFLLDYSNPPPQFPLLLFPPLSFITHSSSKKKTKKQSSVPRNFAAILWHFCQKYITKVLCLWGILEEDILI